MFCVRSHVCAACHKHVMHHRGCATLRRREEKSFFEQQIDVKAVEWCLTPRRCKHRFMNCCARRLTSDGSTTVPGRRWNVQRRDTTDILHCVLQEAAGDSTSQISFYNYTFSYLAFKVSFCLQSNNPSLTLLKLIVHLKPTMNNASQLPY